MEPILEHLNGLYWLGREGQAGISPVQIARSQQTADAVKTLRTSYDAATAENAVNALMAERSGGGITPSGTLDTSGAWNLSNLWLMHIFGFGLIMGAGGAWLWMRSSGSSPKSSHK